jgi:hypothetical protein
MNEEDFDEVLGTYKEKSNYFPVSVKFEILLTETIFSKQNTVKTLRGVLNIYMTVAYCYSNQQVLVN